MERYSNSTREVAQDGRRGALMMSVSIKHPDSEAFIDAKMTEGKVTGANVSVRIDDDFMRAATEGTAYTQQFPVSSEHPDVTKDIDASASMAQNCPQCLAVSRARSIILGYDYPRVRTRLLCRPRISEPYPRIHVAKFRYALMTVAVFFAINLYSYVKNPFTPKAEFDFDLFRSHVAKAQRVMDDIIDLETEKIDKILQK